MPIPILQTKLYTPPLATLVPRPQLVARLSDSLQSKLILVSAPAGFGKTTLISPWLQQLDSPAAWLSLDEGDSHEQRFLRYLTAALQTILPARGESLLATLQQTENPAVESILVLLLNDLATVDERLVLVLEDYHVAATPEIGWIVTYLLENAPPNFLLVITTRVYPELPVSRLRVRSQLLELQADDLRFSTDEVRHLLNQLRHFGLSADELLVLHTQTEGWAAGLPLAALSLEHETERTAFIENFRGTHRYVTEYLMAEVLQ
ncbi:MAG: hypothetical protein R3C14_19275 [Caldilineaceae bacterium]